MILTICPNPCVDCTLELEKFFVGRLNRIEHKIEHWAGKALNTAVGVARLGENVTASGFMFNSGGRRCCLYLESEGVKTDFIWSEGRLRVNYKIIDGKSMMTELNDRGDTVSIVAQEELLSHIRKISQNFSTVVVSGSLPGGVEDDYYLKMVESINPKAKIIVDCEGDKLLYAISGGVFMVKPNLYELEMVNKETYQTKSDMLNGCRKLIEKGAQTVLLSLGKEGAILTDGTNSYFCKSANVAVNSTVGAGDSMLSAACVALDKGLGLDEVLRCGVSAGTASIATLGTNLFYKDKYEEIYSKLKTERI